MSDIYLQITETPTVVTLSAPVVSGALASTVTVANTVTVALDSNSLSALENVTVTVGAAITGTVTVSNFPASQAVTFSAVTISNFPATQTIAGTVTANLSAIYAGEAPFSQSDNPMMAVGGLLDGFNEIRPIRIDYNTGGQIVAGTVTANLANVVTTDLYSVSSAVKVTGADGQGVLLGGVNSSGNPENVYEGGAIPVRGSVGMDVPISGTVTANLSQIAFTNTEGGIASDDGGGEPNLGIQLGYYDGDYKTVKPSQPLPISGTVTIGNSVTIASLPALVAGTAQIGSVTASIGLNSVGPSVIADSGFSVSTRGMMVVGGISTSDVGSSNEYRELKITSTGEALVRGTVTIGSLPAISGTVTVGNSVTIASLPAISGTVTANTFALQGTAVTTSNFTSTTASTVLAGFNATREVLSIFNEGAGNLHICAGATCTTIAYQVRLSAGDYYEVPNHQTTITHSAVFATAGTARVTEVS